MERRQIRFKNHRLFDAEYDDNNEVTLIFKHNNKIIRVPFTYLVHEVEEGKEDYIL